MKYFCNFTKKNKIFKELYMKSHEIQLFWARNALFCLILGLF